MLLVRLLISGRLSSTDGSRIMPYFIYFIGEISIIKKTFRHAYDKSTIYKKIAYLFTQIINQFWIKKSLIISITFLTETFNYTSIKTE